MRDSDDDALEVVPVDEAEPHLSSSSGGRRRGWRPLLVLAASLVVAVGTALLVALPAHTRAARLEAEVERLDERLRVAERRLTEVRVDRYVTVPDLAGTRYREATAILAVGGFAVGFDGIDGSPDGDAVVRSQHPSPGVRVPRGTGVVLILAG